MRSNLTFALLLVLAVVLFGLLTGCASMSRADWQEVSAIGRRVAHNANASAPPMRPLQLSPVQVYCVNC